MANMERVQLLTAALRSGKYKQGTNRLTTIRAGAEHDCCLGVACKVYMQQNPDEIQVHTETLGDSRYLSYNGCSNDLPRIVQEWYGFRYADPMAQRGNSLIGLNDGGASFAEIAEFLDRYGQEM